MDIKKILQEYDSLFCHAAPDEIHRFLTEQIRIAESESDHRSLLTLLNEQIGYARETDQRDTALQACKQVQSLLCTMNLKGTIPYGNSMLNIANASRKFALYDESLEAFQAAERAYRANLSENDYAFAGLYNNWSILAMDQHQYDHAVTLIRRAIAVIDCYDKAIIEQATSRINLAIVLNLLAKDTDSPNLCTQARNALEYSIKLFEQAGGQDYHYSAALAALADMQFSSGDYIGAVENYERAACIVKMYMGNNSAARNLLEKKQLALTKANEAK